MGVGHALGPVYPKVNANKKGCEREREKNRLGPVTDVENN